MTPDPNTPGTFHADWTADQPGSYLTEVIATRGTEELGRDVLTFARMDGVAENFHTEQNRELLEKLSEQTGGRYWKPQDLPRLPGEISYSEAGITVRDTKELWNMPIDFPSDSSAAFFGMALAAEVGSGMRVRGKIMRRAALLIGFCVACMGLSARSAQAAPYYVTVAGLGGEPDYEQRFTALAKELDKLFKAAQRRARVHAHGQRRHQGTLDRYAGPDRARRQAGR